MAFGDDDEDSTSVTGAPTFDPPPQDPPAPRLGAAFGDDDEDSTSVTGAPTFDPPEHDPAAISLDDDADEDRTTVDKRPGPR
jgi:hypothetical protein